MILARRVLLAARGVGAEVTRVSGSMKHCVEQVRTRDYAGFFASTLAPREARVGLIALRALNVEVATVKDNVSEVHAGQVRMHWWRETVDKALKGQAPHQPVAELLAIASGRHKMTGRWFTRMIEAREADLAVVQPESMEYLEQYGEATMSSVLYLSLEVLGVKDVHVDHAASHLGKAAAIVNMLRGVPQHAARGMSYLPADVMRKHGVSVEQLAEGVEDAKEAVASCVFDVATIARGHLLHAYDLQKNTAVAKEALPALLAASVPTDRFLAHLQKCNFDIFDPSLASPVGAFGPFPMQCTMLWRKTRGRF